MSVANVVLISSKIVVSRHSLSYSPIRSQYTSRQRFQDLLLTIQSVKSHIPNPYIILIDNSSLPLVWKRKLEKVCNDFLNPTKDRFLRFQTDISPYKGLGECCQLLLALKHLQTLNLTVGSLFKIAGRYVLNDSFRMGPFLAPYNIFKRSRSVHDRPYYFTCFFKITGRYLDKFYQCLIESVNVYRARDFGRFGSHEDLEVILPAIMGGHFVVASHLGVTQKVAIPYLSNNKRDTERKI